MKPDISKYKVFFFDFDGVIADTVDIKTEAFGELFKKHGKEVSLKVMEHHRDNGGVSRYEKFRHYYKHLLKKPINPAIMRKLDNGYSQLVFRKVVKAKSIKGAKTLLGELKQQRKPCFVISATPQKEIRRIVKARGLQRFFKDTVGSPKVKADNLKLLLKKYRVFPSEGLYFGDARSDWEAAKASGVDFAGIINKKSRELLKKPCAYKAKDLLVFCGSFAKKKKV